MCGTPSVVRRIVASYVASSAPSSTVVSDAGDVVPATVDAGARWPSAPAPAAVVDR